MPSCLTHVVNEIYNANISKFGLILGIPLKILWAPEQVFALRVQNKASYMLMCLAHLIIILLPKTKCLCTLQGDSDFFIESLQRRYCKSYSSHYCENMHKLFLFKYFNN